MNVPNFLIIGAAKSGTRSLYRYLGQHPDVFMSPVKEPNFFAFEGRKLDFQGPTDEECINSWSVTELDAYRALFAEAGEAKVIGEASWTYLYVPASAERIRHRLPNVRLIAILRNPVERAFSNFTMFVCDNAEPYYDFSLALRQEEARVEKKWSPAWHYKRIGFYAEQLARYYDLFDERQINVYLYEDLKEDAMGLVQDVFRFLDVDDTFKPDVSVRYNASGMPLLPSVHRLLRRSQHPIRKMARAVTTVRMRKALARRFVEWNPWRRTIPHEARRELVALYREDILRLQELIGRDLSAWLKAE